MVYAVYTKIGWLCFGSGHCVYGNNSGNNTKIVTQNKFIDARATFKNKR